MTYLDTQARERRLRALKRAYELARLRYLASASDRDRREAKEDMRSLLSAMISGI